MKIGDFVKMKEAPYDSPAAQKKIRQHSAGVVVGFKDPKKHWWNEALVKFAHHPNNVTMYRVMLKKITREEYEANATLCFIESCNE